MIKTSFVFVLSCGIIHETIKKMMKMLNNSLKYSKLFNK